MMKKKRNMNNINVAVRRIILRIILKAINFLLLGYVIFSFCGTRIFAEDLVRFMTNFSKHLFAPRPRRVARNEEDERNNNARGRNSG